MKVAMQGIRFRTGHGATGFQRRNHRKDQGDILHFELLDKGEAVDPAAFPSDGN